MAAGEMGDFVFDTSSFENGLKRIVKAMGQLPSKAGQVTSAMSKTFQKSFSTISNTFQKISKVVGGVMTKPITTIKKFGKGVTNVFGGIKSIFGGIKNRMTGMNESSNNMAKGVIKGMTNMALKAGVFMLALKGIRGMLNQMPEVGQAFGLAKDIFLKNFLFPLRKAVFPYLQKLLDWVRNNRQMFVKWGQVVANVFGVVVDMVKKVIEVGRSLLDNFMGFLTKVFGTPVKNLQDLMNLLTFKFAVVLTMLKSMAKPLADFLQPLIEAVGIGLAGAFETATIFAESFFKAVKGAEIPIQNMLRNIKGIVSNLFKANEQGNSLKTIFSSLGELAGKMVKFLANMYDSILTGMRPALEALINPIQRIADSLNNIFEKLFASEKSLKVWKSIFNFLGKVIGTTLVVAFETIAFTIEAISKAIDLVVLGIEKLIEVLTSPAMQKAFNQLEKIGLDTKDFLKNIGKGIFGTKEEKLNVNKTIEEKLNINKNKLSVDDAIIKPSGEIIRTHPNDTIIATKNPIMTSLPESKNYGEKVLNNIYNNYQTLKPNFELKETAKNNITNNKNDKKININIDFSGMQLVVNEATKEEAEKVGLNIVDVIRDSLAKELEILGV